MRRRLTCAWLVLVLGAVVGAAPAGSEGDPASYRIRVPVVAVPGAPLQRLAIPAQVLAASQTADLADIRVFDARGRAMPIARAAPTAPLRRDALKPLPILGAADAVTMTGMSIRLDDQGRARLAAIDGAVRPDPAASVVIGVLLDGRAIAGSARSLTLEAEMPTAVPVTFVVDASDDLKDWRPIAETVVYRAPDRGSAAREVLPLGAATLDHEYLRVTWHAASRLPSVVVRSVVLLTRAGNGMVSIDAALPPVSDTRALDVVLPFAVPVSTIAIIPRGDDMLIPVRVLGRNDREHPWAPLGEGIASRGGAASIVLAGGVFRTLRVEAARAGIGFTATPSARFGFAAREIVFLAGGVPPYVLAAGRAGTANSYLPFASLRGQAPGVLPVATTIPPNARTLLLDPVRDAGAVSRQWLLWGILIGATALLGAMAWALWKRRILPDARQ